VVTLIEFLSLAHMSISTYFRPNIHKNGPEILGVNIDYRYGSSHSLHPCYFSFPIHSPPPYLPPPLSLESTLQWGLVVLVSAPTVLYIVWWDPVWTNTHSRRALGPEFLFSRLYYQDVLIMFARMQDGLKEECNGDYSNVASIVLWYCKRIGMHGLFTRVRSHVA
jgi:hypothetical protein